MTQSIPEDTPQKQCSRCKQSLPLSAYGIDRKTKDGRCYACKACREKPKTDPSLIPEGTVKQCSRCEQWKSATTKNFRVDRRCNDGLDARCKDCANLTKRHQVEDGYKCCTKCNQKLPATHEYFTKSRSEKYGLCAICRECKKRIGDASKIIGTFPTDETMKQCTQCKQMKPANKSYFGSDRSKTDHLSTQCKSCKNLKKREAPRTEEYREKYRRQKRRYYHKYHEREKAKTIAKGHVRRARKTGNGGSFSRQDIQEQRKRQKNKCYYCQKRLQIYHIEHIVPICKGGSSDMSNIVLACPACNLSKGYKLLHEWSKGSRLL